MLNILGISMRNGNCFRVMTQATEEMNKKWLDFINENYNDEPMTFEEALKESCYISNYKDYLVMEIEIDLDNKTSNVVFYFDDYENIDVKLSNEDFKQCVAFIEVWKNMLPDNEKLMIGDEEWYAMIPDDVPWK